MIYRNENARKMGIKLSGGKCIVCGWNEKGRKGNSLVEGAHVRSYDSGSEYDLAENIIALCPNHHTEYDAYNFYIDVETRRLVFYYKSEYDGRIVKNETKHINPEYLAYRKYMYDQVNNKEEGN